MANEKESRFDNAGQKASTPSPFRAANTVETLRPREVNTLWADPVQKTDSLPLQGRGLPPLDYEEPPDCGQRLPEYLQDVFTPANVLPVDWPTATATMKLPNEFLDIPLARRVAKLEGLVDGLLDRIALYNTKSSHKI